MALEEYQTIKNFICKYSKHSLDSILLGSFEYQVKPEANELQVYGDVLQTLILLVH